MLVPMPTSPAAASLKLLLIAAALACAGTVQALELRNVSVEGIADEEMRDDVDDALSLQRLNPRRRTRLTESRLSYLLRRAPGEARKALEPYGFYDAEVVADVRRDGDAIDVVVRIDAGEPVVVTVHDVVVTGPAADDPGLQRRTERFRPREGQVFHHGIYEDSKAAMDRALAESGYFDAKQTAHRVSIERATHSAKIDLAWDSGERYALGEATFDGHLFRPGLLEKLVSWDVGEPYRQQALLDLQKSLAALDYFAAVDVVPQPEAADASRRVPVTVTLAPAKRDIYSAGVRYGTDTGVGVHGGWDRRWVNDRGHKFRVFASVAQEQKDISTQYRIPAFKWLDGWYAFGASLREETVDDLDSQLFEVIGSRDGRLGDWTLTAALRFRRERYEDVPTGEDRWSTLVFPSLLAQWSQSDDPLYPRSARGLTAELRGGHSGFGSDIDFLQLRAEGRWIHGWGRRDRVLVRGEVGTTLSDEFPSFPPSLRFYAGGDRSVRGYGWREIGEVQFNADGREYVVGGKHVIVGSAEFEHMFDRTWGMAVFVDAGDAFDVANDLDLQIGAGVGLRWRSPVGPVRLDLAHGFGDQADQSVSLHLNIGPDL